MASTNGFVEDSRNLLSTITIQHQTTTQCLLKVAILTLDLLAGLTMASQLAKP